MRSCCLRVFPGIRDEIKIYSLPADCSDLFSAPDRGSFFGVSNSCALWRFGPRREPSQLMCFLMPCIASKFHASSFFLFRIYSESILNPIPNPILKPIPKLQKREKTQDILQFIDILCFLTFLEFRNRFQNRIRNRIRNRFGIGKRMWHEILKQYKASVSAAPSLS